MKFDFLNLTMPVLPIYGIVKYRNLVATAACKRYEKRYCLIVTFTLAACGYLLALLYPLVVWEWNLAGSAYFSVFAFYFCACLAFNLFARKRWQNPVYAFAGEKKPTLLRSPEPREVMANVGKQLRFRSTRKLMNKVIAKLFPNLVIPPALSNRKQSVGTEFALGYEEKTEGWVYYGWRGLGVTQEDFHPRHVFISGKRGYGQIELMRLLLLRANAGRSRNRVPIVLSLQSSGEVFEEWRHLPNIVHVVGEKEASALLTYLGQQVMLRSAFTELEPALPEFVLFTDPSVTDCFFGFSGTLQAQAENMELLIEQGKRNGVHLVARGQAHRQYSSIPSNAHDWFQSAQFFTNAEVTLREVVFQRNLEGEVRHTKVPSPSAVAGSFLWSHGNQPQKLKQIALSHAMLAEELSAQSLAPAAASLLNTLRSGIPVTQARWQEERAERAEPVRIVVDEEEASADSAQLSLFEETIA